MDASDAKAEISDALTRCAELLTEDVDRWKRAHAGDETVLEAGRGDGFLVLSMRCLTCRTYNRLSLLGSSGPIPL